LEQKPAVLVLRGALAQHASTLITVLKNIHLTNIGAFIRCFHLLATYSQC
jgi:hypothetical protein